MLQRAVASERIVGQDCDIAIENKLSAIGRSITLNNGCGVYTTFLPQTSCAFPHRKLFPFVLP